MDRLNLREQFIQLLAARCPRAVEYFLRGWTYPTDGKEMAGHNQAVSDLLESVAFPDASPLERLAALDGWLRPVSQKMPRNARRVTPGYAEAEGAWSKARSAALRELPREQISLLREDLHHVVWRDEALARYPTPAFLATPVLNDPSLSVLLVRYVDRDQWHAYLLDTDRVLTVETRLENDTSLTPEDTRGQITHVFLRAGHLSPRKLHLTAVRRPTADDRQVVSVCVFGGRGVFAAEFVELDGRDRGAYRGSAWRENASPWQAELPHIGSRVRLGDTILEYVPLVPQVTLEPWTPSFLHRIHLPERAEVLGQRDGNAYIRVPEREAVFSHPDHYAVRVTCPITPADDVAYTSDAPPMEHEYCVCAFEAQGRTQYVPLDATTSD